MTSSALLDVLVVGGCSVDYMVRASDLPTAGGSVTGDRFLRDIGGKGLNQAVAASRCGARVALIAAIGDDADGEDVMRALASDRIDSGEIVRVPDVETAHTLIVVDKRGRKQTASHPAANHRLADLHLLSALFGSTKSVLAQLEVPVATAVTAARMARDAGIPFVLDAAPFAPVPDELFRLAAVVNANGHEASLLSGIDVVDRESARAAGRFLQGRGARRVTVGTADGRAVIDAGEELWLPNHAVSSVDTTGAGDAFTAAMSIRLIEGVPFADACRFGHAAAALATTVLGARASLPDRAAIEDLLRGR
jgi:ribokinase